MQKNKNIMLNMGAESRYYSKHLHLEGVFILY